MAGEGHAGLRSALGALAAALAALAALPAGVGAATVSFSSPNEDLVRPTLLYVASAGEKNALYLRVQGTAYALRERGAPLTAGEGCIKRSPDIFCAGAEGDQNPADVELGDRADSAFIAVDGVNVFGRAGNDEITVSVRPAKPFPDASDPNAGVGLSGGSGKDRLQGGPDNDGIAGSGGNDVLIAGGGNNDVDGGHGSDVIYTRNKRTDVVDCGTGHDIVFADRKDRLAHCERVHRS